MDEQPGGKLTAEEASAIVSQWAERHPVTAEELAERLKVDPAMMESLLNQSRGRLSMEKWASQRKPSSAVPSLSLGTIASAGAFCVVLGGFLGYFLFASNRAPKPAAEVQLGPNEVIDRSGLVVSPGPGANGMGSMAGMGAIGHPTTGGTTGGGAGGQAPGPSQLAAPRFAPVAGDGDPAQRAGLIVGTDLARMTLNSTPDPNGVVASDQVPVPHKLSRLGFPHPIAAKPIPQR